MKQPCVYIITNWKKTVLYTGVTSDLLKRIYQHKNELIEGFSKKYKCKLLVYYELFEDMENAILREKQIKGYTRKKKDILIEKDNKNWEDLSLALFGNLQIDSSAKASE